MFGKRVSPSQPAFSQIMHNHTMPSKYHTQILTLLLAFLANPPLAAQEPPSADDDGSSEQVEDSDEAFRRRMELEDARRRDPSYTTPLGKQQKEQEKIDELPPASRENIRDQLVGIIMEEGQWEPSDALEEYPYEPTAAAREDADLMRQEQEAWDEQIEKYHEREAAAFGAYRTPPGNPGGTDGQPGESGTERGEAGGSGQAGQAGSAGSYAPYTADRSADEDEVSTAGAQQSALDFLRGAQGPASADPAVAARGSAAAETESARSPAAPAEAVPVRDLPGVIAIEDLDKLEGVEEQDPGDDAEPPPG